MKLIDKILIFLLAVATVIIVLHFALIKTAQSDCQRLKTQHEKYPLAKQTQAIRDLCQ